MLTEICNYLKNWFEHEKYIGHITVSDNVFSCDGKEIGIEEGQYFRIIGSIFSDGVHKYGDEGGTITDKGFNGAVWLMAVPPDVIALAGEIKDWMDKYGGVDSVAMSPYNSESFGGYSYSKSSGSSADGSNNGNGTWQGVYGARLARYRKI